MPELSMRPGPGWRCVWGPVWDHASGLRVHVGGECRLDGRIICGGLWPEFRELDRFIRINGGNRKRGTMAWALQRTGG
jgi:hypothetical protein